MLQRHSPIAKAPPAASTARAAHALLAAAALILVAHAFAIPTPALAQETDRPEQTDQPEQTAESRQSQQSQDVELDVEIIGLEEQLRDNVEALTQIVRTSEARAVRPGHVYRLFEKAPEQIATALEPFGFYDPVIRSTLTTDSSPWVARFAIDPGEPTLVSRLDVRIEGEAGQDSVFRSTLASLPLAEGDTLNHQAYEFAKQRLGLLAADRGYFDAAWDSSLIRVDREAFTAEIVLHMTSGPRFRFGEIRIDVMDWVDSDILAPAIHFEPGDPYHSSYLRELQSGLAGTTYFANVEIIPRRDLADEELRVPIEVHARPRKTQRWEVGLGYGTDTGPRVRLSTEFRRLNRRGHYADFDTRLATTEQSLTARYNIPVGFPNPSLWTVTGRFGNIEWVTSKTLQGFVGLSFAHLRGDIREVLSIRYQHDDFSVAADTAVSNLTQPIASWTWAKADDRMYATRGAGGSLELRGAAEGVGSSASFFRAFTSLKAIFPLARKTRGIVRAEIGYLGTNQFHGLPPSIRFFAGGDRSIRGYQYQALGPLDEDGGVTGGNTLAVGSTEVEYRLFDKWSVAVFLDAGNAFNDFQGKVMFGTGFGARWISPVGLIRIDAGFGLNKEGSPFRLHLGIGPDF